MNVQLELLPPTFHEKIWGSTELEPWFPNSDRKIGEVWFPAHEILIKFIFTSERLSVQVHPDDAQAPRFGYPAGKTEMWFVLRAGPGAVIGLGFREPISPERMREAALSGEIEFLLDWKPARAGDTFFVPAGTVHAIGPNLVLCEIQQNTDVTFRLYDYGRPRPLHLDEAVAVASGQPHPGPSQPVPIGLNAWQLAACPYFVTELWELQQPCTLPGLADRDQLLVLVRGEGMIMNQPCRQGQVWRVPPQLPRVELIPQPELRLLRTYLPKVGRERGTAGSQ